MSVCVLLTAPGKVSTASSVALSDVPETGSIVNDPCRSSCDPGSESHGHRPLPASPHPHPPNTSSASSLSVSDRSAESRAVPSVSFQSVFQMSLAAETASGSASDQLNTGM